MCPLRLLLLFPAAILAAACSHPNPIVGTWSGSQTSPTGVVVNTTWTFQSDGKNTMSMTATRGPYANEAIGSTGTYTADNGPMTQMILTMSEPGRTTTIPKPAPTGKEG